VDGSTCAAPTPGRRIVSNGCHEMKILVQVLVLSASVLGSGAIAAGALAGPPVLSDAIYSTVTEEITHPIRVREYLPKFEVLANNKLDDATAEAVVSRYLLAMQAGDYEAAYKVWDKEAQRLILRNESDLGVSRAARVAKWASVFGASRLFLTHSIEYGKYSLIEYSVINQAGQVVADEAVATVREGDRQVLTMELLGSAVLQGWKNPAARVRKLAPGFYGKQSPSRQ